MYNYQLSLVSINSRVAANLLIKFVSFYIWSIENNTSILQNLRYKNIRLSRQDEKIQASSIQM